MRRDGPISLISCISFAVIGCAYYQQSIAEKPDASPPPFSKVIENPSAYLGAPVVWAGEVIDFSTTQAGSEITITQYPLIADSIPTSLQYSQGQFIAQTSKQLDRAKFRQGQVLTVFGTVSGQVTKPRGSNAQYSYATILINKTRFWKEDRPTPPNHCAERTMEYLLNYGARPDDPDGVTCNNNGWYFEIEGEDTL